MSTFYFTDYADEVLITVIGADDLQEARDFMEDNYHHGFWLTTGRPDQYSDWAQKTFYL